MPSFRINSEQQIAVVSRRIIESPDCIDREFVLISARDHDAQPVKVVSSAYLADALFLCFDDIDGPCNGCIHMTEDHAKQIVDFVSKHKTFPVIVCQCEAGVSRSSAMAAAITWFLTGDDSAIWSNKFFYPNRYIYRLIVEEFVRRGTSFVPKFDQPIPYVDPDDPIF